MNSVAVIFNTNQLGGAERSLIEQLSATKTNKKFYCFIPQLQLSNAELKSFILSKGLNEVHEFKYPSFLYKLSRQDYHKLPLIFLSLPMLLFYFFQWHSKFKSFSKFYINGNKAILPVMVWAFVMRKKIKLYWHFRDFPSPRAFRFIGKVMRSKWFNNFEIKLIANSFAVEKELKSFFPQYPTECLYNLSGKLTSRNLIEGIHHIGIASMLAPWKGLHCVLLMLKLYEEDLRSLGIKKISFFGEAIYQTAGVHQSYAFQIQKFAKDLKLDWVEWAGKVPPEKIFNQIDLLIHPSISPEPFGRVILESFKARIPVISTGIGGASELIGENGKYGLKFLPYDYQGLFLSIKRLIEEPNLMHDMTNQAFNHAENLENTVLSQTKQLIDSL